MLLSAHGATHVGRRRTENEDAFLVDHELGLYVVCDGMGGHAAGEVASARTVQVIRTHVAERRAVMDRLSREPTSGNRAAAVALMEEAIQLACSDVYRLSLADPAKRGMGTTCVALLLAGEVGVIGHVGDSRIYLARGGQAHRLTEDHTLVQAQIKQGVITRDQAEMSPYRNVITRAVGIQASVHVDTLVTEVLPGDVYVLCSDGLHGYLEDEETAPLLSDGAPSSLPDRLIDLANERGGKDNITVIAVHAQAGAGEATVTLAESRIEALRRIPLFHHLSYKEQMAVLAIAQSQEYDAGATVVEEGAPGDRLYVVVQGRVGIETAGAPIAEIDKGGHFGEMGLIEQAGRSATVRALEPTHCMTFGRTDLMALMRKEPVLAVKLLWSLVQVLSERLRATNAELSDVRVAQGS